MGVTGASSRWADRVRSLVYLDAFLPDNGQSLFDLQVPEGRENFLAMQRDTPGLVPPRFAQGPGADPEFARTVGPHPLLTLTEPVKLSGAEKQIKHRTYILASNPPAPFQRFYDKLKALNDPSWKLATIPTGHAVQVEDPKGTAELFLAELAR